MDPRSSPTTFLANHVFLDLTLVPLKGSLNATAYKDFLYNCAFPAWHQQLWKAHTWL